MKMIWVIAAAALVGCEAPPGTPGSEPVRQAVKQEVHHQVLKGGNASASWGDQYSKLSIDVGEAGQTAYLQYFISQIDPTSEVCYEIPFPPKDPKLPPPPPSKYCVFTRFVEEWGYGSIPAADVAFQGKGARLDTTVAHGSDFLIQRCVIDLTGGPPNCDHSGGGPIQAAWHADGQQSQTQSGIQTTEYQTVSFKTAGSFRTYSAKAAGAIFGKSFESFYGLLRSAQGAQITKGVLLPPPPPPLPPK